MSNKKKINWLKIKGTLRYYLGSYTPPEFIHSIPSLLTKEKAAQVFGGITKKVGQSHKTLTQLGIVFGSLLALSLVSFIALNIIVSKHKEKIPLTYTYTTPVNDISSGEYDPLIISFNGSAAPVDMIGKELTSGIAIEPNIPGTWTWIDDDTLRFDPSTWWEIGGSYTVSMDSSIFPEHIRASNKFTFYIKDFNLSIIESEFYIDPENSSIKRVIATIEGSYPINVDSLSSRIALDPDLTFTSGTLDNKPCQFTLSYSKDYSIAYLVSDPIGVPVKDTDIILRIKKGVSSSLGGNVTKDEIEHRINVPGAVTYVGILSLDHQIVKTPDQKYDQVIILITRGKIDADELLKKIDAWELPRDRPEVQGLRPIENHEWSDTSEILPEILQLSRKINLTPIPGAETYNDVNSLRFEATPGRYIYFTIKEGARFYGDYFLNKTWGDILYVKDYPKEVSIVSEGTVLSLSGDRKLSMFTRGIPSLSISAARIRPDDINHLVSQSNGDLSAFRFTNYQFNEYNISEQYEETVKVPIANERDINYLSFDFSKYLETIPYKNLRNGLFIYKVTGDYPYNSYTDKRLIMVTDLGFFIKNHTDGKTSIFVQSIASGNPVPYATVEILGLNGNVVFSAQTGEDGYTIIPKMDHYSNENRPIAYVVKKGEDLSFMPYSRNGRVLDYSSFDTGGIYGATDPKKLHAFIFSDRGMYRPGDEIRFGLAVKAGDWTINLDKTPLEYIVTDPKGTEIASRKITLSRSGFEEIKYSTQDWSPTGTYTTSVYVIHENQNNRKEFLGSATVKVEEFLPETLNVSALFDPLPNSGWINPQELNALITVRNLFGTPAAGNNVKAQINLTPGYQYFRQYRDYTFLDPFIKDRSYQEFLGTQQTTENGTCSFPLDLSKFEKATYYMTLYTEAFEKGSGRKVSAETSVMVSPLPYLIGYKPDGTLSYINQNSKRSLSLIAIDPKLNKTAVNDLTLSIIERRYVSMLVKQHNGTYKYQSIPKGFPVSSQKISISPQGYTFELPSEKPGEYIVTITNKDGLEYTRAQFSVAGSQNLERSLTRTAELELSLNKKDFSDGDTVEIMIKAPYAGSGLITIERDKVYSYKWFKSDSATSVQTITVPHELEGNGYINVMFVRSQSSPEIYMSPLSYGIAPFSISKDKRTNKITLELPEEAKPGKKFPITYSTRQEGKIIVYAVDEGILQLAQYVTPNPIAFFFKKRALEVQTSQIMDLILPEHSVIQRLAAMGGGAGYEALSRNLNPFKRKQNQPVAFWSGILDSGPDKRTIEFPIPDYFNGTVRVMAVVVSDNTIGAIEDKALIRNTFIISPNAPMIAAPGDEFEVSVTVTNNQKNAGPAGKVALQIQTSEHLILTSPSKLNMDIPEGRDKTIQVTVKAAGPVGAAEIRFKADNAGDSSELAAYMSVRPAVPYRVALQSGMLKKDREQIAVPRKMYEEFSTRDASLSYLPLGIAKGLNFYLEKYPYDCSEQITSAAFPFIYPELSREFGFTREETDAAITRVLSIIQARMKTDNSIGVWTSLGHSDPFITVYCAHFITEASLKGHYVSPAFMSRIHKALKTIADSGSSYSELSRAYAIYVLTLNEEITSSAIESLKKDITESDSSGATGYPGLFMAGSYAMLKKDHDASMMLGRIKRALSSEDHDAYLDSLSYQSLYLTMIARHFPSRLKDISGELLNSMAQELQEQRYSSLSASMALMAIDAYLKAVPTAETGKYSINEINEEKVKKALSFTGKKIFSGTYSSTAKNLEITNPERIPMFYQVTQAGFDLDLPTKETKNGIEVFREFTNENGKSITSAKLGDVVYVKLNFRSLTKETVSNVALVDLLPAGLEVDIASIREDNSSSWQPDYVDIREDRIVVFGSVREKVDTYVYQTRAINKGTYIVPPLFAEALYDKTVWALRPQDKIVITGK